MSDLADALAAQIRLAGLPEPVREHRFHPTRRWRFDICFPEHMVAVECEGGTYIAGRHSRGRGYENDCLKYNQATLLGWQVFRVTSEMVRDGRALSLVEVALTKVVP
jgi:hypothetical protein